MRNYSSTAQPTTLSAGIDALSKSLTVLGSTGFPAPPFTLVLDPGLPAEEIVTVNFIGGVVLGVIRGEDGTKAVSHAQGASVRHMATARDFRELRTDAGRVVMRLQGQAYVTTDITFVQPFRATPIVSLALERFGPSEPGLQVRVSLVNSRGLSIALLSGSGFPRGLSAAVHWTAREAT